MRADLTRQILDAHRVAGPSFERASAEVRSVVADHVLVPGESSRLVGRALDGLRAPRVRAAVGLVSLDESLRLRTPFAGDVSGEVEWWRRRGAHLCRPGEGLPDATYLAAFAAPGRLAIAGEGSFAAAGAFGVLVLPGDGVELGLALAGLPWDPPPVGVFGVRLTGTPLAGIGGTDLGLALARELPAGGARGQVIEFHGEGVAGVPIADRIALCRMGALLGARAMLFPADEVTRAALHAAGREPDWKSLAAGEDAGYERRFELDLDRLEPLCAPAGFPGAARRVRQLAGQPVARVWLGDHTTLPDLERFAVLLERGRDPGVKVTIVPGSRTIEEAARRRGVLARLRAAGATVAPVGSAPGAGERPGDPGGLLHGVSPRHMPSGGRLWRLAGIETCAASARAGRLTDPRELTFGAVPPIAGEAGTGGPDWLRPLPAAEPAAPMRPWVGSPRLEEPMRGEVLIAVGDHIDAARILPAGPRLRTHGYDPESFASQAFASIDSGFAARARRAGGGFVVAGAGFGAGDPGEEAALALAALGVRATLAIAYDPAFHRRLVHAGILPLQLRARVQPESLGPGDELEVPGLPEGLVVGKPVVVRHLTRGFQWALGHALDERDLRIVRLGGAIRAGLESAAADAASAAH